MTPRGPHRAFGVVAAMNILIPEIPVVEKVIRSAAVYLFLPVGFRLADKRQLESMTVFDLVVLLVISNVVQNALTGNDKSLGRGLLGATPILGPNAGERCTHA